MIDFAKIRKNKGYKQEEVAEIAGVCIKTVYHFEHYDKVVSKDSACRILKVLDIHMTYEQYCEDREKSYKFNETTEKKLSKVSYSEKKHSETLYTYKNEKIEEITPVSKDNFIICVNKGLGKTGYFYKLYHKKMLNIANKKA